ncbi:MAG: 5-formyltetrahydrofolate cyclo-ligase [Myxococcota bacterium]
MSGDVSQDAHALRRCYRAIRDGLDPELRAHLSIQARAHLWSSRWWSRAFVIGLFSPIGSELDPVGVLDGHVAAGRRFAFPRISGTTLEFRVCRPEKLVAKHRPSFAALKEPDDVHPLVLQLDLVVVPGLVFGRDGSRLGYGGGYYDRTLRAMRAQKRPPACVGIGFSQQLRDVVPRHGGDETLDGLITDTGVYVF